MEQKEINTNTLREWLDSGKKVNVLDVRPINEREEWQIPGSIHLDVYDELKKQNPDALNTVDFDKSIPVVTVCAGGKTSMVAAQLLQKAGYESYNLEAGMKGWNLSWNTASRSFDDFEIIQFRRTGKGCLSYLIISEDEAMILDASLPVKVYEDFLNFNSLNLKYAADTHIHADHLSRTKKLAENYKLQPSMPSNDKLNYPFDAIKDGQIFMVGKVKVKAIHTPGHTLESTCYLVDEKVIFTGDTLFFGGVGRPDLKANNEEAKYKATLLFRSLQKLIEIDQSVILMPGHSSQPISFDSQILQSSLKDVISNTPLLLEKENDFISLLLNRIPATPENYLKIVDKNISGDFTGINPIDLEAGAIRCAVS